MTYRGASQDQINDHRRDERKADWRPGDRGFEAAHNEVPARLDRPITTAEDIAICVRGMKNVADAAVLIQQYADMVAVSARVDQHQQSADTVLRAIDPRLARKEPSDAQA